MSQEIPTDDPNKPYEIRITQQGKMKSWIEFALNSFKEHPDRPLIFHTLPASKKQETPTDTTEPLEQEPSTSAKPGRERMPNSTMTIPKLVSVAEIIKREYLKSLPTDEAEKNTLTGLHQYNELGTLPEEPSGEAVDPETERLKSLSNALTGKNHLKMRHVAYMKITLSRKAHPELCEKGASYQSPALRKLSKSARNRSRRRQKKNELPTVPMES